MAESTELRYDSYITLDFDANSAYTTIAAKQTDGGSRHVLIHLTRNNQDYQLENGVIAQFRCRKPDGHAVLNLATILDSRTDVDVELTAQALAVAGRAYADVVFTKNGQYLSTVAFIIIIMAAPDITQQVVSSDEFGYIQHMADSAQDVINEAERWATGTQNGVLLDQYFVLGGTDYYTSTSFTEPPAGTTTGVVSCAWDGQSDYGTIIINGSTYYVKPIISVDNNPIQIILENPQFNNNAKFYAEKLEHLSVSADTSYTGTTPSVIKTVVDANTSAEHWNFEFKLPAGPTGATGSRGPSTVLVSSSTPTAADTSVYDVWLDPTGALEEATLSAKYILYDYNEDYSEGSLGNIIRELNTDVVEAKSSADEAIATLSQYQETLDNMTSSFTDALNNGLNSTIKMPPHSNGANSILTIDTNETVAWSSGISYSMIGTKPIIQSPFNENWWYLNENALPSASGLAPANPSTTTGAYYHKPEGGIPQEDLSVSVQNALTGNMPRHNFFDNNWFIVHQRGFGDAYNTTPSNTYIVDRWFTGNNGNYGKCGVERSFTATPSQGLVWGAASTASKIHIKQYIAEETYLALEKQAITVSAQYRRNNNGNYEYVTKTWDPFYQDLSDLDNISVLTASVGDFEFTFAPEQLSIDDPAGAQSNSFKGLVFSFGFSVAERFELRALKLEIGNTSTLAIDSRPIKSEEFKNCEKFLKRVEGGSTALGWAIARSTSNVLWRFPVNSGFASDSFKFYTNSSIALNAGGTSNIYIANSSAVTINSSKVYSDVSLQATTSGASTGTIYAVFIGAGQYIELSCEPYVYGGSI